MSNHQMLDNITHQNVKIKTGNSAALGDGVSATGVFPSEFSQLQAEYPILLKKNSDTGQFESIVLLGFENAENLFLSQQGWQSEYLPLSIARQPFLIGFQQSVENGVPKNNPVVTIDMDHPRVNTEEGEPVFLPSGGSSPYLDYVTSVLMSIHQGHEERQHFTEQLLNHELVEPFQLSITFENGSSQTIEGLYTINEDRLRELPAETAGKLHSQGYLQHIYMMLASIANIRQLIKRKEQKLAGH